MSPRVRIAALLLAIPIANSGAGCTPTSQTDPTQVTGVADPEQAEAPVAPEASQAPEPPKTPKTPRETPRAAVEPLTLGTAQIEFEGAPGRAIKIASRGEVSLGGRGVGVVRTDGVLRTVDGEQLARIMPSGALESTRGGLESRLAPDGVHFLLPSGREYAVRFRDDGEVRIEPADGKPPGPGEKTPPKVSATGCEGAKRRTCAFVFAALTFLVGTKRAVAG